MDDLLMSRKFPLLMGRSARSGGDQSGRKPRTEIGMAPRAGHGAGTALPWSCPAGGAATRPLALAAVIGQSCSYGPDHDNSPYERRSRIKSDVTGAVAGPQAGNNWNRGPGTTSHRPPSSPSSPPRTCACTRYVAGWIKSVYLSRESNDTEDLSSCLVTSTSKAPCFIRGRSGR
jgi:hypothetical protein